MRLLIMGPPGAGKGTQAVALAARLHAVHISTGELLRAQVRAATSLGVLARAYMDRGAYVPDEITSAMVKDRLAENGVDSAFILDGFPRTEHQVLMLDDVLADLHTDIDAVIQLIVGEDELIRRLSLRATTEGRADDTEEVIGRRLQIYHTETEPLIEIYRQRGKLLQLVGTGSVDDVGRRLSGALQTSA